MSIKARATIEDLYKVEGKAELVHGEIVQMPPAGETRCCKCGDCRQLAGITPDVRDKDEYLGMRWDSTCTFPIGLPEPRCSVSCRPPHGHAVCGRRARVCRRSPQRKRLWSRSRASDPSNPTIYRRGEIAEAEPAVPGWRMP